MAEIVLVHGIDQQQMSADKLESEWLPCLAGGVRAAGFPDVADRIWRDASKPGNIETRMAFYGDLFLTPGLQGGDPDEFNAEEAAFAEQLALEWLRHAAERATREQTRRTGALELAYVTNDMGAEQGAGSVVRSAVCSLAKKVSWFAPYRFGFAERFVNRSLAQVTRYFTSEEIRSAALASVSKLIGPETNPFRSGSLPCNDHPALQAAHRIGATPCREAITLGSNHWSTIDCRPSELEPQPPRLPGNLAPWMYSCIRMISIARPSDRI